MLTKTRFFICDTMHHFVQLVCCWKCVDIWRWIVRVITWVREKVCFLSKTPTTRNSNLQTLSPHFPQIFWLQPNIISSSSSYSNKVPQHLKQVGWLKKRFRLSESGKKETIVLSRSRMRWLLLGWGILSILWRLYCH